MHAPYRTLRRIFGRLLALAGVALAFGPLVGRVRQAIARRTAGAYERSRARNVLPSLYERIPEATRAPQRRIGLRSVALDDIVGTMRYPSQNTADFLPLPKLRGENWRGRWQRINRASDRLDVLPPVDLVQVGDEYYVADGHNRVAAARRADALEIDADVVQLLMPGHTQPGQGRIDAASLVGTQSVRQAGAGRMSRTVEQRDPEDLVSRRDLARERDGHDERDA